MPQSGYTPIQIYASSTGGNTPSAGNLTNDTKGAELAINIADGKLFYKDSSNVVQVLANASWSGTVTSVGATAPVASSGGTTPTISMAVATSSANGYLSSTDWSTFNGKQAALVSGTNIKTVNGTTLLGSGDLGTIGTGYGGTGLTSFTANRVFYASSTSAIGQSSNLTFDGTNLTVGGTVYAGVIASVNTNSNLNLSPNGTGSVTTARPILITDGVSNNAALEFNISGSTAYGEIQAFNYAVGYNNALVLQRQGGGVSIGTTSNPGAGSLFVNSNIGFGTTAAGGDMSNTARAVGGYFRTYASSGTIPNATPTTIATVTGAGLYIVHAYIPGYVAGAGSWSNYCIVSATDSSHLAIVAGAVAGTVYFSISGSNIQLTQSGGSIGYEWSVLRIA